MSEHSLTTTPLQIVESEEEDRRFLVSATLFNGAVVAYVRLRDVGPADAGLVLNGSTMIQVMLPKNRRMDAWTNAGTSKLVVTKLANEQRVEVI